MKLEQTGPVMDYVKDFERLLCLSSLVDAHNDDNHCGLASPDQSELVGQVVYKLFSHFPGLMDLAMLLAGLTIVSNALRCVIFETLVRFH